MLYFPEIESLHSTSSKLLHLFVSVLIVYANTVVKVRYEILRLVHHIFVEDNGL